jgi:hypothetical protein
MARLRRGTKVAGEKLTRDARRVQSLPVESAEPLKPLPPLEYLDELEPLEERDTNVSEPVKVLNLQEVAVAKKDAVPTRPVAALNEAARRRERLLTAAVMNQFNPVPTVRNEPKNPVGKAIQSWLAE